MFDLIIIGGGMAGMTAALYALRNNKTVLILEREAVGGQIAKSPKVENYPTIKQISGMELSNQLFEQVLELGAGFELENVLNISKNQNFFEVVTDYNAYSAKAVVVATGSKPRMLELENEDKFVGNGVYYCAICDGPFYAGKEIVLIGDANSALQYALMLAGYCKKVNMITLFDRLFGEKSLIDAVKNNPKIEIVHNMEAVEFLGDESLSGITFRDKNSKELVKYNTEAVFVAIGQVPDNKIFADLADLDSSGYFVSDEKCATKTAGLFVAGDCRQKTVRQVTTAIADGATAAIGACRYIDSLGE